MAQFERDAVEHGDVYCPGYVALDDVALFVGTAWCEDSHSVWQVALEELENFNPARHELDIEVAIGKSEHFISSRAFDDVVMMMIAFNTLTMCCTAYTSPWSPVSSAFQGMLTGLGHFFSVFFFVEMLLKIVCLKGLANYLRPNSNKFDCLVVMSSVIAFPLMFLSPDTEIPGTNILRIFRLFRALRVARMLRKIDSVRKLLDAAFGSLVPLANILVCMTLIIVVFACFSMQLFGGNMKHIDDRRHFDDFPHAFYSLFVLLTGSGWEEIMYQAMMAKQNGAAAGPLLLTFFIVQNYIVLNLFVGAILANMSNMEDEDKKVEMCDRRKEGLEKQIFAREAHFFVEAQVAEWETGLRQEPLCRLPALLSQKFFFPVALDLWVPTEMDTWWGKVPFDRYALGFLGPGNKIRVAAVWLVEHDLFEVFLLITIIVSTLMLVIDTPEMRKKVGVHQALTISEPIFIIIFTFEFFVKAAAYGLLSTDNIELMLQTPAKLKALTMGEMPPPPLLHDSWAYIDMTVLFVSYISYFGEALLQSSGAGGTLKIVRLLRAIRPLRIVNRVPGMRIVIVALQKSGPGVANVLVLIFFTFLIFAIIATDMTAGKFYACTDPKAKGYQDCMGIHVNEQGSIVSPRVWRNPHIGSEGAAGLDPTFDNVGRGFLLLFELATLDDWEGTLFQLMDIPDKVGSQPVKDGKMLMGLFLVVFVFCGALFMMQLFISVVIDAYCDTDGSSWLTEQQQLFCNLMELVQMLHPVPKPSPPEDAPCRRVCYNLFVDPYPQKLPILEGYKLRKERPSSVWPQTLEEATANYANLVREKEDTVSGIKQQVIDF